MICRSSTALIPSTGARSCREKLALKLQNIEEQDEIARTQEMVDILRKRASEKVNPVIGRSVNAKAVAAGSARGTADQGAVHRDPRAGDRAA